MDRTHYRVGPGKCKCGFDAYQLNGIMLDYGEMLMIHLRTAAKQDRAEKAEERCTMTTPDPMAEIRTLADTIRDRSQRLYYVNIKAGTAHKADARDLDAILAAVERLRAERDAVSAYALELEDTYGDLRMPYRLADAVLTRHEAAHTPTVDMPDQS